MENNSNKKYNLKILAVDDTIEILYLIQTILKFYFEEVITAEDGLEGLRKFKEHSPDIIISDLAMPNLDGLSMAKQIKDINPEVPIILQTAFDEKEILIESIDIGIDSYLRKPLNTDTLIKKILKAAELVTLRKELEYQYKMNKLISLAVEQSPNRLIIMSSYGIIEYCNPTFLDSLGLSENTLLGKKLSDISTTFIPDTIIQKICNEITNKTFSYSEFQHKEQVNNWFSYTLNLIKHDKKITHFTLLFTDITLRKSAETALQKSNENLEQRVGERTQELLKAKEAAEAADKAKSSFLAKVSHELRTPLNGILGLSSILIENEGRDKEKNFLEMIYSSGKNLLSIINDILDYSKLDEGKVSISEHKIMLEVIIENSIAMQLKDANEKGILVSYIYDNRIPKELLGDSLRIHQILTNLLNNAIKFTNKGKIQVFITLKELTNDCAEILINVQDGGIGIPKNKISELFQSFSQVENYMTRTHGGTGLGLAISKEIVQLMGGKIWVESEENKGSSFKFTLKLKIPCEESDANKLIKAVQDEFPMDVAADYPDLDLNILIAEDSLINQEVLKQGLSLKNWKLITVTNGTEALEVFESIEIDLILMDIQMPVLDGIKTTERIREIEKIKNKSTIIIALTAHANDNYQEECLKAGMNGFISKPFNWRKIYNMIYSFFDNKKAKNYLKQINLNELLHSINYNKQVFRKIAEYYHENYSLTLNEIEFDLKNNDKEKVKLKLHKLKSELSNFGAEVAIKIIKIFEDDLNNKISSNYQEYMNNLKVELKFIDHELIKIDLDAFEIIKEVNYESINC